MTVAEMYLRLIDAVNGRLETARAATAEPWSAYDEEDGQRFYRYGDFGWYVTGPVGTPELEDSEQGKADAAHIAANDPAIVIRMCERDIKVLNRHGWTNRDDYRYGITCLGCPNSASSWPCPEIRDLAEAYEVSVE